LSEAKSVFDAARNLDRDHIDRQLLAAGKVQPQSLREFRERQSAEVIDVSKTDEASRKPRALEASVKGGGTAAMVLGVLCPVIGTLSGGTEAAVVGGITIGATIGAITVGTFVDKLIGKEKSIHSSSTASILSREQGEHTVKDFRSTLFNKVEPARLTESQKVEPERPEENSSSGFRVR
jgi:hypothetical protein